MAIPIALTIGGSDSGGGAGIQADLKTFTALAVHGCSAISCVTAQNTLGVKRVDGLPPAALTAQIEAVVGDLAVGALKTGMLLNQELIEAAAAAIAPLALPKLIDPVMVSRAGAVLLEPGAIDAYRRCLLPQAELLTPNLHEARLLSGLSISGAADVERAAERLLALGPAAVLVKGGGLAELRGRDYLLSATAGTGRWLEHAPVATPHTHGSGCTLGAAITAGRARGLALEAAVEAAKAYVEGALRRALAIGGGQGPLCHWHGLVGDAPRWAHQRPAPMATAPYLLALALLEQEGRRALPLQGQSLREPLAAGAGPGEAGERQALELLVRVWQRSEQAPLRRAAGAHSLLLVAVPIEALMEGVPALKAAWIASGDTAALILGLQDLGGALWSVASEPRQPLQFTPLT